MNIAEFVTVTVIGTLAVISPGPDFIVVTRNSLVFDRKTGLFTALGICVGNLWWITASIAGLSLVIAKTVLLFNFIKVLGVFYLTYLGIKMLLHKKQGGEQIVNEKVSKQMNSKQAFFCGLLTNILNPKCALFFLSFFGAILSPKTTVSIRFFYGTEIALIALVWFSLLAVFLSVEKIKEAFGRIQFVLEKVMGAVLIALGLRIALTSNK